MFFLVFTWFLDLSIKLFVSKFNTIRYGQNLDSEYLYGQLLDHNIFIHQIWDMSIILGKKPIPPCEHMIKLTVVPLALYLYTHTYIANTCLWELSNVGLYL